LNCLLSENLPNGSSWPITANLYAGQERRLQAINPDANSLFQSTIGKWKVLPRFWSGKHDTDHQGLH
jgi:hypothetical protein